MFALAYRRLRLRPAAALESGSRSAASTPPRRPAAGLGRSRRGRTVRCGSRKDWRWSATVTVAAAASATDRPWMPPCTVQYCSTPPTPRLPPAPAARPLPQPGRGVKRNVCPQGKCPRDMINFLHETAGRAWRDSPSAFAVTQCSLPCTCRRGKGAGGGQVAAPRLAPRHAARPQPSPARGLEYDPRMHTCDRWL